jgi:hypothetical protein
LLVHVLLRLAVFSLYIICSDIMTSLNSMIMFLSYKFNFQMSW